jgi:hypothetical protein
LVSRLLLSISTEMKFWDDERLVDILWIIFNELKKVFFPLLMFFLLASWMQILLGILWEPLFPRCHRRDNSYVTSMFLTLNGSSKLVILMIWIELVVLLQNNKILHSLQHFANFKAFWNQLSTLSSFRPSQDLVLSVFACTL